MACQSRWRITLTSYTFTKLNKIAGENGVGVADIVENRIVGMKSRGIYETPGGTLLMESLMELETIVFDKDTLNFKKLVSQNMQKLPIMVNGLLLLNMHLTHLLTQLMKF